MRQVLSFNVKGLCNFLLLYCALFSTSVSMRLCVIPHTLLLIADFITIIKRNYARKAEESFIIVITNNEFVFYQKLKMRVYEKHNNPSNGR